MNVTKKTYEVLGIIAARGGSKGLPGKNIRPLLGKPLIAWTIEEVKRSKLLTKTIVTTDSEEIAEIARRYGADVPFLRPAELAKDMTSMDDVLFHALDWLKRYQNYQPDIVVQLPPTSPLRTAAHIDEGVRKLIDTPGADMVRPINEAPKHPYKMYRVSEDQKWLEPFLPKSFTGLDDTYNMARQSFPAAYIHTGAVNIIWAKSFRNPSPLKRIAYFHMRPEDSVNIDSLVDFELAELLLRKRLGRVEQKTD